MPQSLGPFSAFVFDMDGVLLDTEQLYRVAMQEACQMLGYDMPDHLHAAQVGSPADLGDRLMLEHFGADFPLGPYNEHVHTFIVERTAAAVPVKPGVFELLEALRARGVPAAVATSTSSPAAPDRLRRAGLIDYFQAVVTRNDVENGKPHPEPFATAAARIGVDPGRCIALEDSFNGIRSAHAAGMKPVMVPDMLEPDDEIRALCHAVLPSLHAVRAAAFGEETA